MKDEPSGHATARGPGHYRLVHRAGYAAPRQDVRADLAS